MQTIITKILAALGLIEATKKPTSRRVPESARLLNQICQIHPAQRGA